MSNWQLKDVVLFFICFGTLVVLFGEIVVVDKSDVVGRVTVSIGELINEIEIGVVLVVKLVVNGKLVVEIFWASRNTPNKLRMKRTCFSIVYFLFYG